MGLLMFMFNPSVCIETLHGFCTTSATESSQVALPSSKGFPYYNLCVLGPRSEINGSWKLKVHIVIVLTIKNWW